MRNIDFDKVLNTIVLLVGSALIGYGTGSVSVAIGVFCVGFSLLPGTK